MLRQLLGKRKPALLIGVVVVVLAVGGYWFLNKGDSQPKSEPITEEALSAFNTASQSIRSGVDSSNAGDALYIASTLLNEGKTTEARKYVTDISNDILSNAELTNKYIILLDSYRMENNKDSFSTIADEYKQAVATRNDKALTDSVAYLTPEYINAVFSSPTNVPPEQEIP